MSITVTGGDPASPPAPDDEPGGVRTVRAFLHRRRRPLLPAVIGLLVVGLAVAAVAARRPAPHPAATASAAPVTGPSPGSAPSGPVQLLVDRAYDEVQRQSGADADDIVISRAFPLDGSSFPSTDRIAPGDYLVHLSCAGRGRVEVEVVSFGVGRDGDPELDSPDPVGAAAVTCYPDPAVLSTHFSLPADSYVRVIDRADTQARSDAGFSFLVVLGDR